MKCLAKSADERYQTGFQLADALQVYLTGAATSDESRLAFYARTRALRDGDGLQDRRQRSRRREVDQPRLRLLPF
jgi:hypothetical protein